MCLMGSISKMHLFVYLYMVHDDALHPFYSNYLTITTTITTTTTNNIALKKCRLEPSRIEPNQNRNISL